jgi:tRNA G18 (ribose-2'-O)-methylase SpoU
LKENFEIIALEITNTSVPIQKITTPKGQKIALLIGNEIDGVSEALLAIANQTTHITMYGNNSSMNVVQATSIALYEISNQLNEI